MILIASANTKARNSFCAVSLPRAQSLSVERPESESEGGNSNGRNSGDQYAPVTGKLSNLPSRVGEYVVTGAIIFGIIACAYLAFQRITR